MSNKPKKKASHSAPVRKAAPAATARSRMGWIVAAVVGGIAVIALIAILEVRAGSSSDPVLDAQATKGKQIALDKGCVSCHSPTGAKSEGPTWQGLYGSTVTLADGTTVKADDAYIKRSIQDPKAQIVQGFQSGPMGMPTVPLTDDEIAAVTAYIKALQ